MKARIQGASIEYDVRGSGLPLLLLHAFPLGLAQWDAQAASLSASHLVVRFDCRGFGGSRPGDGLLSMERIADDAEPAMWPEAARWANGAWTPEADWLLERDRLVADFFPNRADALLAQVRAGGWYPLPAPALTAPPGVVAASVGVSAPSSSGFYELWVTVDGSDPRLPGGAVAPTALGPDPRRALPIEGPTTVLARLRSGGVWGPVAGGAYDRAPPDPERPPVADPPEERGCATLHGAGAAGLLIAAASARWRWRTRPRSRRRTTAGRGRGGPAPRSSRGRAPRRGSRSACP